MRRVPIRVACHAIVRIDRVDVVPLHILRLRAEVEDLCSRKRARLVELAVESGAPKQQPDGYRALDFVRNGLADVLLLIRAPWFDISPLRDWLESATLKGQKSMEWLTVPMLRRLGVLPPAMELPSFAARRATELRRLGFSLDSIARWLDTEGYAAPSANAQSDAWTEADIRAVLNGFTDGKRRRSEPLSAVVGLAGGLSVC